MSDRMRIPDPGWIEGDDVARGLVPEAPDNWLPTENRKALEEIDRVADAAIEALQDAGSGLDDVGFGDDAHWYAEDESADYLDDAKAGIRLALLALKRLDKKVNDLIDNGESMEGEE